MLSDIKKELEAMKAQVTSKRKPKMVFMDSSETYEGIMERLNLDEDDWVISWVAPGEVEIAID